MHALVGLSDPDGVYLVHAHKLGQGTEHWLHGALPFAFHVLALPAVDAFYVPFIFFPVVSDRELFLVHLAQTTRSHGAALADLARCPVRFLFCFGTAVQEHFPERDDLAPWTKVTVMFPVVRKTIGAALIGAVRGNEASQAPFFRKGIVLPAAVARVGHTVLPYKALLPQPPLNPLYDIRQLLVVLPVGMVRPDVRYYMVGGIHAQLAQVVQLPGLARLDADTRVRVHRTVMGLVARVLAALVPCPRPLVPVLRPFPVPAFYGP